MKQVIKKIYHYIMPERIRKARKKYVYGLEKHISRKKRFIRVWNPDSRKEAGMYPEAASLWKKWIYGNEYNNCGDFTRFYSFVLNLDQIIRDGIEGAFAELGVYRGNSASVLGYYARERRRELYLFDTFEGFDAMDIGGIDRGREEGHFSDTSMELVKKNVGDTDNVRYVKGHFPESIPDECAHKKFAFVSLDCDLYKPISEGLKYFWPRLSGGVLSFATITRQVSGKGAGVLSMNLRQRTDWL